MGLDDTETAHGAFAPAVEIPFVIPCTFAPFVLEPPFLQVLEPPFVEVVGDAFVQPQCHHMHVCYDVLLRTTQTMLPSYMHYFSAL